MIPQADAWHKLPLHSPLLRMYHARPYVFPELHPSSRIFNSPLIKLSRSWLEA
jgi:hypothetical protein